MSGLESDSLHLERWTGTKVQGRSLRGPDSQEPWPKRAVPGRVSEGEPKFEEVVARVRKEPGDTRQTKDPEGA
jgi:hypothetical protein